MTVYYESTRASDTARNCALLMDRIADKYGCEDTPRKRKGARAEAVTPELMAALRRQGFFVHKPKPQVIEPQSSEDKPWAPRHSIFEDNARALTTPEMRAALLECLKADDDSETGRAPHGTYRAIADKRAVRYAWMMCRLNFERKWRAQKKRKAA